MEHVVIKSDSDYAALADRIRGISVEEDTQDLLSDKFDAVQGIVQSVREFGDTAVAECTERFDNVKLTPEEFELTPDEIDEAVKSVEPDLIAALERAYANIQKFHEKNLRETWEETFDDGTVLGQRVTPIERVGVYVPGGRAFYPSSVLMNIAPARVAGVKEIVMVSPPSYEGGIHPVVLAAARIAGATRIFRVGGAQAVAALAFGTKTVPHVLKITGPGNIFVTLAKRVVRPWCDIDTEAGPSEVVVIADESANPRYVAGEMLAQAEHDADASSVLITTDAALVEKVEAAIEEELKTLSRAQIIRQSLGTNGKTIVARTEDEATALSNLMAPEHLAVYTKEPRKTLENIENAAAIMLGEATTVVLGDYYAGPNHILPTTRRARFASPLSAEDFRKVSSLISFSPKRVKEVADDVIRLANAEELTAHARAIEMRQ